MSILKNNLLKSEWYKYIRLSPRLQVRLEATQAGQALHIHESGNFIPSSFLKSNVSYPTRTFCRITVYLNKHWYDLIQDHTIFH